MIRLNDSNSSQSRRRSGFKIIEGEAKVVIVDDVHLEFDFD